MTAGTIYKVDFETWQFCQVFGKGHKIRVAISSSNFPRFSANFNNGILSLCLFYIVDLHRISVAF